MGSVMKLNQGDPVRVMDDNGSEGWPGRVVRVHPDAAEVEYASWTEVFRLPDGRRGSRYLVPAGRRGPLRQIIRDYVAPVETGEPFRSAAEREWDASRGD